MGAAAMSRNFINGNCHTAQSGAILTVLDAETGMAYGAIADSAAIAVDTAIQSAPALNYSHIFYNRQNTILSIH